MGPVEFKWEICNAHLRPALPSQGCRGGQRLGEGLQTLGVLSTCGDTRSTGLRISNVARTGPRRMW